ncbi:GNAT family N-acetyltransferase [Aestuariibaculum sediminum]|uniref:GNAT family N-acetyltransferase n=1 Tax=Aestuariibaculum sediminum TaxID=2770637 RepID=A0A8J6PYW1_9FLAO|nr:GNAT family N-acetyltransferase [Aestuariibaculum sediminum]MBD0831367.1 GNAT family N-acetyltransferase [Aestuariibaculum sediminum]
MFSYKSFDIDPINTKDYWSICDFVVANENRLKRFFPITLKENQTPDLSKLFTEKKAKLFVKKQEFLFTVKEKVTNLLVGLVYLKSINWDKKQGELAYCIGYQHKGKGLMSEVVKIISDYAFKELGLKTLQIIVDKNNTSSVKVAKNCNFTWIKTLSNAFTPPGESSCDMELYELYNEIE